MKPIHTALAALVAASTCVAVNAAPSPRFIGELTPVAYAERTVVIGPETRWVDVTQGERVKFLVNGRAFAVAFDGVPENVNLQRIAPDGMLDHRVVAYVAVNPFDLPN